MFMRNVIWVPLQMHTRWLPSNSEIMDSCLFLSLVRFLDFSSSSARLALKSATLSSSNFRSYKNITKPVMYLVSQVTYFEKCWFPVLTFSSLLFWSSITRISSSSFLIFPSQVTFSSCSFWRASSSSSKCSSNSCMKRLNPQFLQQLYHTVKAQLPEQ